MNVKWPRVVVDRAKRLAAARLEKGASQKAIGEVLAKHPELYLEASTTVILELTTARAQARKELEKGK